MHALENLSEAALNQIQGVIFDIDDTITRDGIVEAPAYHALHRLRDAGLRLAALTGRPLGWTDVTAQLWPIDLAIGENGAGWSWCNAKGFHEGYFCDAQERAQQKQILTHIETEAKQKLPKLPLASDQRARRCDLAFDIGEHYRANEKQLNTLRAIIEATGAQMTTSSVHAHALTGNWDKAQGARRALKEVLDVDLDREAERWIFIGDSSNDAKAFEYFPLSVGVANVREHLGKLETPPIYITASEYGEGFAELAELLLQFK